jgi:putative phosphoribosyl transferase
MSVMIHSRSAAGRNLARALLKYRKQPHVLVLAITRGGVPIAAEIARELQAPLDLMVFRTIGTPAHADVAMGALAAGGTRVVDGAITGALGIGSNEVECMAVREETELERSLVAVRGSRPIPAIADRCVILVDEGVVSGATLRMAIRALRAQRPQRLVAASPVGSIEAVAQVRRLADEVVCLATPAPFGTVGQWYAEYPQVTDEEVKALLMEAWRAEAQRAHAPCAGPRAATGFGGSPPAAARMWCTTSVRLHSGKRLHEGSLTMPEHASGLVLVAHAGAGSASANLACAVAETFVEHGLATLHFDLMGSEEGRAGAAGEGLRRDVKLIAERVGRVLEWISHEPELRGLPVGLFATDIAAAAALEAAAASREVSAIVALSGRPDLVDPSSARRGPPTLFLIGGADPQGLALTAEAAVHMGSGHRVEVIPGATALFPEAHMLEQAARHARAWLAAHLARPRVANEGGAGEGGAALEITAGRDHAAR